MFTKQIAFLLCLGASALNVFGQQVNLQASLHVSVTDPSGTPVAGVRVTAFEVTTLISRSALTGRDGRTAFSALPAGHYEVTTQGDGIAKSAQEITLTAGRAFAISFSARLAGQNAATLEHAPGLVFDAPESHDPPAPSNGLANLSNSSENIQPFRLLEVPQARLGELKEGHDLTGGPHGVAYGFLGDSLMELNTMRVRDFALAQYGTTLGGSINHDRTSYFASLDRQDLHRNTFLSNSASSRGSAMMRSETPLVSSQISGRDHQFGERDTANLRFHRSTVAGNLLGQDPNRAGTGFNVVEQSAGVQNTFTVSPNTVNETRAQFIDSNVQLPAGSPALGIQSYLATLRRNRVYEAADNLQHQLGRQTLRLGGDFFYNQMSVSFLEASLGNPGFSQSSQGAGAYVANQWRMRPDLVISTGVRYDLQFVRNVHTDTNNLAPQIGFAWSPGSSTSTVIRGDFGVFYEQLPVPAISGAFDPGTNAVNLGRSGNVSYPRNNLPITAIASFTTVDPFLQSAYAEQAGIEFEQQLGTKSTISAEYRHVRGVQLAIPVPGKSPLCGVAAVSCGSTNEFRGTRQYEPGASSSYNGVTVSFTQRPTTWGNYRLSYIYSSAQSSAGEMADAFVADQMRRIAFDASLHTATGAGSTVWQHLSRGFVLSGYGDYTSRHDLPGLSLINFNAQLSKTLAFTDRFHLDAVADSFNTLLHRNYSMATAVSEMGTYEANVLSSYERFAIAGNPNVSRLGLRLTI